jgi:hypothetical protein
MAAALGNLANIAFYSMYKTIMRVYAAAPVSGQTAFQRLRFTQAFKVMPSNNIFQ